MAMNSKNTTLPEGKKYKVTLEKDGEKDFMMLYALSPEEAMAQAVEAWKGTSWKPTSAEEARR